MKRPRVCHVSPLFRTKGGITTVVSGYLARPDFPVDSVYIESHRDGSAPQKLLWALRAFGKAAALRLSGRVDILQVHVGDFPSIYRKMLVTMPFLAKPRCSTVLHMHGAAFLDQYAHQPAWRQRAVKAYLRRFDIVIALSERWKTDLERAFGLHSVTVLPNAVPVPEHCPERDFRAPLRLIFLGMIGQRKGVFDLLEAMSRLKERGIAATLTIGGNGDIERLQAEIAARDLGETVRFVGWVSGEDRAQTFTQAHALVLPSYAEGAPMSVIEGMAAGLPILSTTVGAIPEMVEHGKSGFLVEPGDAETLATAISTLAGDPALCARMAQRSHELARQRFSLEAHLESLLALYRSLPAPARGA